jgi:undecaprenyl phosphate N,N'-diacetylbacillosamine 1-phosphate transferase
MLYRKYFKRLFDFTLSLLLFIVTSPIFILLSLVLLIPNRGKILFIQPRPGKNGKIFRIFKFKTMTEKKNIEGELLPDNERITWLGKMIRNSSLDELPQLLNVLKGELSLIGPRPLLVEYLPLYNDFQKRRHELKPGITGWAQINGRNAISWDEKFKLDIWYVDNISFGLDCRIMLQTILKVLKSSGISSETSTTVEKFIGN